MLSFLKKKTDASASQLPAWHPNFRNYERLPDIKVVRTAFFVNGAAVFIAVALAAYFAFGEYQLSSKNRELESTVSEIETNRADSTKAVALFQKFKEEQSRISEVELFVKSKPLPSNLLQHLAETRPASIVFEKLDILEAGMTLRAWVPGRSVEAFDEITKYSETLKEDPVLKDRIDGVQQRPANEVSGRLVFELYFPFKATAPKK